MTDWASHKAMEGQRIQQVLGAIGALPAAMLVFGDAPSTAAAGAPLFIAAISLIVGALMNWSYTDDAYFMSAFAKQLRDTDDTDAGPWKRDVIRSAYSYQGRTYIYGGGSLLLSAIGVAAVYSDVRTAITVPVGFGTAIALLVAVFADVVWGGIRRNRLVERNWAISDRMRAAEEAAA